jgi:hypothetical protein
LEIFERLLNREKLDSYEKELCLLLEVIALNFIDSLTLDGITNLSSQIRKPRQIVFEGKMRVLRNSNENKEWHEPFKAVVTDKRITKQGIEIKIWVGDYYGESELFSEFED